MMVVTASRARGGAQPATTGVTQMLIAKPPLPGRNRR